MLTDIFSTFDPGISSFYSSMPSLLFWASNFILLAFFTNSYWLYPSRISQSITTPKEIMHSQVSRTFGLHLKGMASVLTALFLLIITINLTGLIPYSFSVSSHLFFTLALSAPLWLALIMSSLTKSPKKFFAGILPGGAPDWLNPALVLVETMSILFRPLTLAFRLAANMSAGHIVLSLIGTYTSAAMFSSLPAFMGLFIFQMIYIMFEVGICFVQAYIFCLLLSLYSDDHTS